MVFVHLSTDFYQVDTRQIDRWRSISSGRWTRSTWDSRFRQVEIPWSNWPAASVTQSGVVAMDANRCNNKSNNLLCFTFP